MTPVHPMRPLKYRSIWISDVHLGNRGCKAEFLLSFLRNTETETLFLVGDIIDLWAMKRSMYWPQSHNNVIRTLLGKAKHDTKVIYIPGNHDEQFREYCGMVFGNLEIHEEYEHVTADGRRIRVLHGDKYDAFMKCSRLGRMLGSFGYDFLIFLHRLHDALRHLFGFPYWSLASFIKFRVKNAVKHMHKFERVVAEDAQKLGVDGVVCGHIHHAEIRDIGGILYCNDGDWMENCTALVERHDGSLELLHWSDKAQSVKSQDIPQKATSQHAA
jgi:UDP-2,3-diacylglucosamine pyrophosphatase LpxH